MTKLPHQHDLIAVIETNERIQRKVGERGGAPLDFGFDFAVGDGKSSPGVDRRFFAVSKRTGIRAGVGIRSEEHTSELQSLMRNSYAVFCLKKKTNNNILYRPSKP